MALAEARLVTAKLLWHFDMELDGGHETWVDDARFYVSRHVSHSILSAADPPVSPLCISIALLTTTLDTVGTSAADGSIPPPKAVTTLHYIESIAPPSMTSNTLKLHSCPCGYVLMKSEWHVKMVLCSIHTPLSTATIKTMLIHTSK